MPRYIDSDDSDCDEMLPPGAFWPTPEEEEWTMVERSHGILRSAKDIDSDRLYNSGSKLDLLLGVHLILLEMVIYFAMLAELAIVFRDTQCIR